VAGPFSALPPLLALLLLAEEGPLLSPHETRARINANGIKGAQVVFLLFSLNFIQAIQSVLI
jgi:hypothetical protein